MNQAFVGVAGLPRIHRVVPSLEIQKAFLLITFAKFFFIRYHLEQARIYIK